MHEFKTFNGSPTVDGYYTTFDRSEVHRIDESSDDQGGGSSDFSTAEVVWSIEGNPSATVYNVFYILGTAGERKLDYKEEMTTLPPNGFVMTVPIIDGYGTFGIVPADSGTTISASGNASYENEDFIITGDCTITVVTTAQ